MPHSTSRWETFYDLFETRLGWVAVAATDEGVVCASLPEPDPPTAYKWLAERLKQEPVRNPEKLAAVRKLVVRYCAGEVVDLSAIKLDLGGRPPFYLKAWRVCRTVERGQTRTYKWLAEQAGSAKGVRAAGQSMANNPYPLLVPCHRIVGSTGELHGFGGSVGLPMKRRLLEMELAALAPTR